MDVLVYYKENFGYDLKNLSGDYLCENRISIVSLVPDNKITHGEFGKAAKKFKQIENRIQFLFCYYFSVLLDQAVHSSLREEHSSFDNLARYPKFCGILGSFHTNLNPSLLLSLATLYTSDQDFDKATNDVKKLSNFFPDDYYQFFTHEYPKLTGRLERQDLQSNAMYTLFSELSNAVALLFQPNSLRPYSDGIPNQFLFKKWISLISKKINEKLEQIKKLK